MVPVETLVYDKVTLVFDSSDMLFLANSSLALGK